MTREEALNKIGELVVYARAQGWDEEFTEAFETLSAEPCEDAISRNMALSEVKSGMIRTIDGENWKRVNDNVRDILALPSVTPKQKMGRCKDCKWWKDSDGAYRRGANAESQCPINRKEVYEGNGYCFLYEPQEGED